MKGMRSIRSEPNLDKGGMIIGSNSTDSSWVKGVKCSLLLNIDESSYLLVSQSFNLVKGNEFIFYFLSFKKPNW